MWIIKDFLTINWNLWKENGAIQKKQKQKKQFMLKQSMLTLFLSSAVFGDGTLYWIPITYPPNTSFCQYLGKYIWISMVQLNFYVILALPLLAPRLIHSYSFDLSLEELWALLLLVDSFCPILPPLLLSGISYSWTVSLGGWL